MSVHSRFRPALASLTQEREHLLPALLVCGALALRLLYIAQIADSPFFTSPVVDAHTYAQQARTIAAGHWLDYAPGAFWQPPLYPWFLGALYALAGEHFFLLARLVQALWGALSCALLYRIGQDLYGRRVGLLAALALALYGPAIYFDAELLPASLATFLLLALLRAALTADPAHTAGRWLGNGLLLGAAAINVPTVLSLVPCLLAWVYSRKRALGPLVALVAGLLLAIAPVTLRNWVVGDDLVAISWNAGVNFYVGNNPDYPETTRIRPGQAWLELMERASAAGYENGSPNSRYFFAQALGFMRSEPLSYAGLLLAKFASFWQGEEILRNQDLFALRQYSTLLSLLLWKHYLAFPFGLVAPLALAGLALSARLPGPPRLLAGIALSYAGGVILFFVTARYRLPAIPLLLLAASLAACTLADLVRQRSPRALVWLGALVLLGLWSHAGTRRTPAPPDGEFYYNLGHAYIEKGDFGRGIRALQRAVERAPEDADFLFSLGTAYALVDNHERAAQILEGAAALYPRRMDLRANLAHAYFHRGLYARAADEYAVVLERHPEHVETLRSAARATARAGRLQAAIAYYERLRSLDPEAIDTHLALGYLYRSAGRSAEALEAFGRVLQLDPDHADARAFLERESGPEDR